MTKYYAMTKSDHTGKVTYQEFVGEFMNDEEAEEEFSKFHGESLMSVSKKSQTERAAALREKFGL